MTAKDRLDRRDFLKSASTAAAATATFASTGFGDSVREAVPVSAESLVARLYGTLSDQQRKAVCFDWDYKHSKRGLLRTFVSANWNVTEREISGDFYSDDQRELITDIFESIIHPSWHERYYKQLEDDAGGFGNEQSIAIFGKPGDGKFELIMTGRRIDATEAERIGLVGKVVPLGELRSCALDLAFEIAQNAPLAVTAAKSAVWRGLDLPLEEGLRLEQLLAEPVRQSEDAKEGPRAFLEKRPAQFKGR